MALSFESSLDTPTQVDTIAFVPHFKFQISSIYGDIQNFRVFAVRREQTQEHAIASCF